MVNDKWKIRAGNVPFGVVMLTGVVGLCSYCEVALRSLNASIVAAGGDSRKLSSEIGAGTPLW